MACECDSQSTDWFYVTRDLITDPPTVVFIQARSSAASSSWKPSSGSSENEIGWTTTVRPCDEDGLPHAIVSDSDVEKSEGWTAAVAQGKAGMSICFMHSFGKCYGKRGCDPETCQQLHINPEALTKLRRSPAFTKFPQRKMFVRTVRAAILPFVRNALIAGRKTKMEYLEFSSSRVSPTVGSFRYEQAFREWLASDVGASNLTQRNPSAVFSYNVCLCDNFAQTGACPVGYDCLHIHARLFDTKSRDKATIEALCQINAARNDAAAKLLAASKFLTLAVVSKERGEDQCEREIPWLSQCSYHFTAKHPSDGSVRLYVVSFGNSRTSAAIRLCRNVAVIVYNTSVHYSESQALRFNARAELLQSMEAKKMWLSMHATPGGKQVPRFPGLSIQETEVLLEGWFQRVDCQLVELQPIFPVCLSTWSADTGYNTHVVSLLSENLLAAPVEPFIPYIPYSSDNAPSSKGPQHAEVGYNPEIPLTEVQIAAKLLATSTYLALGLICPRVKHNGEATPCVIALAYWIATARDNSFRFFVAFPASSMAVSSLRRDPIVAISLFDSTVRWCMSTLRGLYLSANVRPVVTDEQKAMCLNGLSARFPGVPTADCLRHLHDIIGPGEEVFFELSPILPIYISGHSNNIVMRRVEIKVTAEDFLAFKMTSFSERKVPQLFPYI